MFVWVANFCFEPIYSLRLCGLPMETALILDIRGPSLSTAHYQRSEFPKVLQYAIAQSPVAEIASRISLLSKQGECFQGVGER